MTNAGERWIAIARLLRPQGRRGEILAEPLTDLDVFIPGRTLHMAASPEQAASGKPWVLEDAWRPQGRNAGRMVLKLAGTDTISAAELLYDRQLFLRESELPALPEDTFMVRDLVGCDLWTGDKVLGTVTDIQFPVGPDGRTRLQDAPDLLVVDPGGPPSEDQEPVLVPFVKAWLEQVDLPARRIVMTLPPGLFDGESEDLPEEES
jgi:16S rRNA processing protein RimM